MSEARRRALERSPSLREGAAKVREARYKVDEAYTSAYPTVQLQSGVNRITPPVVISIPGRTIEVQPEYNYNAGVTLRQSLLTFGRLRWAAAASELNEKAIQADLQERRGRVLEEITLAYYDTLLAQDGVLIAEDQVEARLAHLDQANKLVKAGSAAPFDVKRDEAALASSQQQLLEARNRAALARVRLFTLLEQSDRGETLEPTPDPLPLPPRDELQTVLQQRSDLAASRWAAEAARARIELAWAQDNPSLGFQTDYVTRNATGFAPSNQWTVGLNLQIPLFDGGLTQARAGQAREVAEQLSALYDQAERNARLELESLRVDLDNRYQRLEVTQRNLDASQEAARIARLRYANGLGTNVELLDAEAALTTARQDTLAARYQYLQALARYRRASAQEETET